jgi:hypothetical protein
MKSDFMGKAQMVDDEHYAESFQKMLAMFGHALLGSEPEQIAQVIYEAATDGKDQLRYVAGADAIKTCTVTNLDLTDVDGKLAVTGLTYQSNGKPTVVAIDSVDLVFLQNASMTDASSLGSMTRAPEPLTKSHSGGWQLWKKLAKDHPEFGNPAAFNSSIPESYWKSFTVTLNDPVFFEKMEAFSGNQPGTGGLVTFKDSAGSCRSCYRISRTSPNSRRMFKCFGVMRCIPTGL